MQDKTMPSYWLVQNTQKLQDIFVTVVVEQNVKNKNCMLPDDGFKQMSKKKRNPVMAS